MIGRRLGSYELREEIGRGGMGVVYRAVQINLGRTVAVKVLAPHLAADEEFVARFLREARAAANLEHPGIVTIYDVGQEDDVYYFAMQLLPGKSLEQLMREQGRLTSEQAIAVGVQVADALDRAHRAGIYHRDVKPANILIDGVGRLVLTDFGIAWAVSETRLTRAGTSLGSPDYMAPETVQGQPADARSDLYSLGVLLFQALTGSLPYSGDTPLAVAYQHINEAVPDARSLHPDVSPDLTRIVARLMAKRPEERLATASEVAEKLSALTGGVLAPLPGAAPGAAIATPTPHRGVATQETTGTLLEDGEERDGRRSLLGLGLAISAVGLALVVGLFFAFRASGPAQVASGGGAGSPPPVAPASAPVSDPGGVGAGGPVPEGDAGATAAPESTPSGEAAEGPGELSVPPVPQAPGERFTISSRPEGATVYLDGRRLPAPTPVEAELVPGRRYEVRLELAGHRAAGLEFELAELSGAQRSDRELHFPLAPERARGALVVRSSYSAEVRVAGGAYPVTGGTNRIEIGAGAHEVEISAPSVFYQATRRVEIPADGESVLQLPRTARVTVAAAPSRCRVAIDGREVVVPVTVELVLGSHTFEFDWETLGTRRTVERLVTPETGRIFLAAGEEP